MYEIDGIVYAGEKGNHKQYIRIEGVKPLNDYKLLLEFNTLELKIFDMSNFLEQGVFKTLKDKALFDKVYLYHGVPTWLNGTIDVDPEVLYEQGVKTETPFHNEENLNLD